MNFHPSICKPLEKLTTWAKIRKHLRVLGLTRSEQKKVIDMCQIKDRLNQ
jgi:hypothetical protein